MAQRGKETEIKLAVPDAKWARRILRAAGFRVSKPKVFEANTVFDTSDQELRAAGTMLRLRQAGGVVTVTFKGTTALARHKTREEVETTVASAQAMSTILERLGFRQVFRYEKYRTEFQRPGSGGLATIDETPVGVYVELEGAPRWIDRIARELGFGVQDYILASYGRLYLDWSARKGIPPTNMVF